MNKTIRLKELGYVIYLCPRRPDLLRQTYFRDKHGIMFNIFYICTQNPGWHELRKDRYTYSTINNIYQQQRKNEKINETISFQEKQRST
jgi:hypothetical protein